VTFEKINSSKSGQETAEQSEPQTVRGGRIVNSKKK